MSELITNPQAAPEPRPMGPSGYVDGDGTDGWHHPTIMVRYDAVPDPSADPDPGHDADAGVDAIEGRGAEAVAVEDDDDEGPTSESSDRFGGLVRGLLAMSWACLRLAYRYPRWALVIVLSVVILGATALTRPDNPTPTASLPPEKPAAGEDGKGAEEEPAEAGPDAPALAKSGDETPPPATDVEKKGEPEAGAPGEPTSTVAGAEPKGERPVAEAAPVTEPPSTPKDPATAPPPRTEPIAASLLADAMAGRAPAPPPATPPLPEKTPGEPPTQEAPHPDSGMPPLPIAGPPAKPDPEPTPAPASPAPGAPVEPPATPPTPRVAINPPTAVEPPNPVPTVDVKPTGADDPGHVVPKAGEAAASVPSPEPSAVPGPSTTPAPDAKATIPTPETSPAAPPPSGPAAPTPTPAIPAPSGPSGPTGPGPMPDLPPSTTPAEPPKPEEAHNEAIPPIGPGGQQAPEKESAGTTPPGPGHESPTAPPTPGPEVKPTPIEPAPTALPAAVAPPTTPPGGLLEFNAPPPVSIGGTKVAEPPAVDVPSPSKPTEPDPAPAPAPANALPAPAGPAPEPKAPGLDAGHAPAAVLDGSPKPENLRDQGIRPNQDAPSIGMPEPDPIAPPKGPEPQASIAAPPRVEEKVATPPAPAEPVPTATAPTVATAEPAAPATVEPRAMEDVHAGKPEGSSPAIAQPVGTPTRSAEDLARDGWVRIPHKGRIAVDVAAEPDRFSTADRRDLPPARAASAPASPAARTSVADDRTVVVPAATMTGPSTAPRRTTRPAAGSGRVEPMLHIVGRGENFWTISQQFYGSHRYYKALWKANARNYPDIRILHINDVIEVPPIEDLDPAYIEPPQRPTVAARARDVGDESSMEAMQRPRSIATSRTSPTADPRGELPSRGPRRTDPALSLPSGDPVDAFGTGTATRSEGRARAADRIDRPVYKVRRGETLRSIARDVLEDSHRDDELYDLNRDIIDDPARLTPGQILELPEDVDTRRVTARDRYRGRP